MPDSLRIGGKIDGSGNYCFFTHLFLCFNITIHFQMLQKQENISVISVYPLLFAESAISPFYQKSRNLMIIRGVRILPRRSRRSYQPRDIQGARRSQRFLRHSLRQRIEETGRQGLLLPPGMHIHHKINLIEKIAHKIIRNPFSRGSALFSRILSVQIEIVLRNQAKGSLKKSAGIDAVNKNQVSVQLLRLNLPCRPYHGGNSRVFSRMDSRCNQNGLSFSAAANQCRRHRIHFFLSCFFHRDFYRHSSFFSRL